MANITINITAPNGNVHKANLPETIPVKRLFLALSTKMELSGTVDDYEFINDGKEINVDRSLSELEIVDGQVITIRQKGGASAFSSSSAGQSNNIAGDYYIAQANGQWPALIIFVIDTSGSMSYQLGSESRIKVVEASLQQMIRVMIRRSMRGDIVSSRYKLALFTYSDKIRDIYGGIQTITDVANKGYPTLDANHATNTRGAFIAVRNLLKSVLPSMQGGEAGTKDGTYPAPLVCHLTDGEFTKEHGDPTDIVEEIKNMRTLDGHVLVENIFISEPEKLGTSTINPENWEGYLPGTKFPSSSYAEKLLSISSPIPESYRVEMAKSGYNLRSGTLMFYPGTTQDLVKLAFQAACATPTQNSK